MKDSGGFFTSGSTPPKSRSYNTWSPLEEGVTLAWRDVSVYVKPAKKGENYKRIVAGG